ncbi:type IV pilus modification protein PilV [Paracidovorax wautersii]|uniref:Type IV pilus assembly protein PilV n=1 Tax=Paracidovorax wautersii TaxID=1177982 RepID=A0A1I2CMK6_9BURK|nr:type IV pilus modification protein PilV [Paracidovorax wautersii]SFE69567.1 type IV pilus assembly protein PilV [Paracidovorax wautersii]
MQLRHQTSRPQKGLALMESLVAIVILALGILGILGIQLRTLTDTQAGARRAQAIRLIEDLGERLQNNPDAIGNLSLYTQTSSSGATDCSANTCNAASLAAFDIQQWQVNVKNVLPGGTAKVFIPQGGPRQLGVMIGWSENRYRSGDTQMTTAQSNALNAPLSVSATDSTGAAITCPEGQICHIQYLQPTQRCAPWGIGSAQLYCLN